MEMTGKIIVRCDKSQLEIIIELIAENCDVDDSSYKKGLLQVFISGSYALEEDINNAISALAKTTPETILGWLEGDEDPSVTLLSSAKDQGVSVNKLDAGLFEFLEDCEIDDEELTEQHQLALTLGPAKFFTQHFNTWFAPYKSCLAPKPFKTTLKDIIENAECQIFKFSF